MATGGSVHTYRLHFREVYRNLHAPESQTQTLGVNRSLALRFFWSLFRERFRHPKYDKEILTSLNFKTYISFF